MNTENLLQPVQFLMPKRKEEKKNQLQMLTITE